MAILVSLTIYIHPQCCLFLLHITAIELGATTQLIKLRLYVSRIHNEDLCFADVLFMFIAYVAFLSLCRTVVEFRSR